MKVQLLMEEIMTALGALLFLVCAISVIYPLRFLMIPNRLVAICGVFVSFVMIGAGGNLNHSAGTASASMQAKPAYVSSGGCKTDVDGNMKCSHSADFNMFGTSSHATSEMKCGKNPVTLAYECKTSSSSN
jgi:hypothetical protein